MSSSLLDQYRYTISDLKLTDPPVAFFPWHKPMFIIEIAKVIGNSHERLELAVGNGKTNQIVWSEQILYNTTIESTITFKIRMKKGGTVELENLIGEYTDTVFNLLSMQTSSGICKIPLRQRSQLSFTIKGDRFKDMLDEAKRQSETIYLTPEVSWSIFLSYFDLVKTAVDCVSSLHPYSQKMWSILSIVPNILHMHATRNSNVQKLFQRLVDIYKYINEADRLSTLTDTQSDKLKLLVDTTCDCVDFIKQYTKNSAATNFIKGPSFDNQISKFKELFDQIFKTIEDSLILQIGIATSNIEDFKLLDDIPYADNVGLDHRKMCLPGTREKLIKKIIEWVYKEDNSERVLLLSGQTGTGKSAVAHTIAKTLYDRLGSFFCFNRSNKGKINFLFSTISRDLADHNVSWRRNLVQATTKIAIRKSLDPITQLNEMIIKPSNGVEMKRRVVIIIDALDEAGDQAERQILLNLLFERSSELPKNYRIIITSRPEYDIARFHLHSNVCTIYMASIDSHDTQNDIQQFIFSELSSMAEILNAVDRNWDYLLAQKSQNLFIWAKLVCAYIVELEFKAARRLKAILSGPASSVHEMYHQILDAHRECQDKEYVDLLKMCVQAIMVSRRPLSVLDLQAFFGPISGDSKNVTVVLKSLNSLFIGLDQPALDVEVRPIHTSVFDFFLSSDQKLGAPNRYHINTSEQCLFTQACLRVMNEMLRFNICGLETSHVYNRDIPNLDSRLANAIPQYLSYACCYWAYHLEYSSLDEELLSQINNLMCNNLPYLFEVLSLLGGVDHGRSGMQILKNKTKYKDPGLAAHAAEASQFAFEFGKMMTESTPHLYLSALPYISARSIISQQFLPQYPQLLKIDVGRPIVLRPQIKNCVTQRHPSMAHPSVLTFSPKGRKIAAGYPNGDLWVWDYVTGEILCQAKPEWKATAVRNAVFSSNGEQVYCSFENNGNILVWDGEMKNVSYEFFNEEHAPGECRDCTISPDGRYIALGNGSSLSFYERETRVKFFEDISGYTPKTFLFSQGGNFFSFQSHGALRLWDTQKKTFIPFPSITNDHKPKALSDKYIITRIDDLRNVNVYEAWDIHTRTMVSRFEPGWLSLFDGFAFSTNGEDLLHSEGNRHWIWKISTGEVSQRLVSHSRLGDIHITALSSDSKHIAFAFFEGYATHVLTWDDLDQDSDNWDEDNDDTEDSEWTFHHGGKVWLKGRHLIWNADDLKSFTYRQRGGNLVILDTCTGKIILKVNFEAGGLPVQVSPEDNHWTIAYALADRLLLWNVDEKEEFTLDVSNEKLRILAFSITGDRLISCDHGNNIKVWNVRTRSLISCSEISDNITALAFSPTGTTFWVGYETDNLDVFIEERNSESQKLITGPFRQESLHILFISISCNDAYVCVCSGAYAVRISDRLTGESIISFDGYKLPIFSPNQRYVAWIPYEDRKQIRLWDLEKGIALSGLLFGDWVRAYEFSNESKRICVLVGVGETKSVDVWDIETKTLVTRCLFKTFPIQWTGRSPKMALYKNNLLLIDEHGIGKIWDLDVQEVITRLYEDYFESLGDSRSGMTPEHLRAMLTENYGLRFEDTNVLDYALTAWNKAGFLPWTKSNKDGWILGPRGELLFWVPEKMRNSLWNPSVSFMAREKPTKLNFDKFVHGTSWTECKKEKNRPKF